MTSTIQETVERSLPSTSFVTQKKIIKLLTEKGAMTRDELCAAFGFTKYQYEHHERYTHTGKPMVYIKKYNTTQYNCRTTIYDNLKKLIEQNIVVKFSKNNGKRGRPKVYFKLEE